MKRLEALAAAALITGVVTLCMLLIGVNALFNPNSVKASDSPLSAATVSAGSADQAQVTQLENEIAQYQQELDQAEAQLQQYQQVLIELQQRGIIRITDDGRILLRRGGQ